MKNLLKNFAGVLVGLLFGVAASYAISGGPQYPPAKADLFGSFGGVLIPKTSPTASPSPTISPNDSRNSLGVFSLNVSSASVESTGNFLLFSHGQVYPGTVKGVADPTNAKVTAILQGGATITPSPTPTATPAGPPPTPTATPVPTPFKESVNGTMKAHALTVTDTRFATTGVQLRGHAMLNFNVGVTDPSNEPVIVRTENFKVRGFKQSSPTPSPAATATP